MKSRCLTKCSYKLKEPGNPDRIFTHPVQWKGKFRLSHDVDEFSYDRWDENPFMIKFKLKPNALEGLLFSEKVRRNHWMSADRIYSTASSFGQTPVFSKHRR
ncbi:MAG TPA: hypothetical protein PKC30_12690 [Saprospiraceae bacterium]|nr:hypothetical protein [Saprospiraceae bacterium]